MIYLFLVLILLALMLYFILNLPQFGRAPSKERQIKISNSSNFHKGKFRNQSITPQFAKGITMFDVIKNQFKNHPNRKPAQAIPSVPTDLSSLPLDKNALVWFGHSSYLLIFEGKRILVDPVFSGFASPFSFAIPAFEGSNTYQVSDMPEIDILMLTHDHFDHLDYKTIKAIKPKVKSIITTLGVGEHLEKWGYDKSQISELNWDESLNIDQNIACIAKPSRHFSGRTMKGQNTLWASFILKSPKETIYIGSDSGYDSHFKKIGEDYGPFDLVILENGQYNDDWPFIHMTPAETVQAALDLKAKKLFPVHWGKFALAFHPWNQSISELTRICEVENQAYFTAKIGELVDWNSKKEGEKWWEQME